MKSYRILWIALAIFLLDQATKWIVHSTMQLHQSISVLGDFFRLTYVENRGMAFGIHVSHHVFFTVFAILASLVILLYLFKIKGEEIWPRLAMTIILGGALGNLLDRIFRGQVVDFLDFEFFDVHLPAFRFLLLQFPGYEMERWPVFNVADIAVTVGMIMLLIYIVFLENRSEKGPETPPESEMVR
jgi:signal peptidase II